MSASQLCTTMYGALYFSTILSTCFYGITWMQTFFYYVHYPSDPLRIKSFVAAVCAFNTIHEALTISGAYKFIMRGLVEKMMIRNGVPELIVLLTVMVATPTQGFFIYRIYVFSGKSIVAPLIWIPLAIYQLVSTTIYVSKALYSDHGIHVAKIDDNFFMGLAMSCLSIAAAIDISTAISLTFLLVRKRATTGYSGTAHILQRLTVFAINTGIWTATFALLTLVLLRAYPSNLIYTVFGIPLCSVYCNTLLANLNVRAYFRDEITTRNLDLQASEVCRTKHQSGETKLIHMSDHLEQHRGAALSDIELSEESESV